MHCKDGNCHILSLLDIKRTVKMELVSVNGNCTVYPGRMKTTEFTILRMHVCSIAMWYCVSLAVAESAIAFVLHHGLSPNTMETSVAEKFENIYIIVVLVIGPRKLKISFTVLCTGMECNASTLKLTEGLGGCFIYSFSFLRHGTQQMHQHFLPQLYLMMLQNTDFSILFITRK